MSKAETTYEAIAHIQRKVGGGGRSTLSAKSNEKITEGKRQVPILIEVTRSPQALRRTPILLAVTPLPSPLTTPPVTNTYFIFG